MTNVVIRYEFIWHQDYLLNAKLKIRIVGNIGFDFMFSSYLYINENTSRNRIHELPRFSNFICSILNVVHIIDRTRQ